MTSWTTLLFLPLSLLALYHSTTTSSSAEAKQLSSDSSSSASERDTYALTLHKRSGIQGLSGPPSFLKLNEDSVIASWRKLDDHFYYIWMPSYGYIAYPKEEFDRLAEEDHGIGNLLRYGCQFGLGNMV